MRKAFPTKPLQEAPVEPEEETTRCKHDKIVAEINMKHSTILGPLGKKQIHQLYIEVKCSFCREPFLFRNMPGPEETSGKPCTSTDKKIAKLRLQPPQ